MNRSVHSLQHQSHSHDIDICLTSCMHWTLRFARLQVAGDAMIFTLLDLSDKNAAICMTPQTIQPPAALPLHNTIVQQWWLDNPSVPNPAYNRSPFRC
jgi:hypothetical protein